MTTGRTKLLLAAVLVAVLTGSALAQSQNSSARLDAIQKRLTQIGQAYDKLPPKHQALLDGYSHLIHLSRVFPQVAPRLLAARQAGKQISRREFAESIVGGDSNLVRVNDPSTDLDFSGFDGLTQSETSSAMCGNQVVVGFNDSGSELQTFFSGPGGLSFSGAAVSSDRGMSFKDIGFMNPGSDFSNFIIGDPVLTCTNPSTFYYTQLFSFGDFSSPFTAVAISKSTDGGNTWADPVAAVSKNATAVGVPGHFLDKSWSAIDPSNPSRIFVSYTDFDSTLSSVTCGNQFRAAIEMVVSSDGGQTFGSPIVIDEQCGNNAVQASHIAVSSHGVAYIAWERFTSTATDLRVVSLTTAGTLSPSVLVDQRILGGDAFLSGEPGAQTEQDLQGEFRDLVAIDLAVDHSGGPHDGTVYLVWDDGRNKSVPDLATVESVNQNAPFITGGAYFFTDILMSRSTDGAHFTPAIQINKDKQPVRSRFGHDHYQPAVAVDGFGEVGVCWYDRRNDPRNFRIERYCSASSNGGARWSETRVRNTAFAPIHRLDFLVNPAYLGDYDGLTSDFSGKSHGFLGAFEVMSSGMNPDVKAWTFR
jgi:hypothetical protein